MDAPTTGTSCNWRPIAYGRRSARRDAAYGFIRYADATVQIDWTDDLRELLLETLDEMRDDLRGATWPAATMTQPDVRLVAYGTAVDAKHCRAIHECWRTRLHDGARCGMAEDGLVADRDAEHDRTTERQRACRGESGTRPTR